MWSCSQRAVWFWAGHLKSELQNKDNNSNSFVYPTRLLRRYWKRKQYIQCDSLDRCIVGLLRCHMVSKGICWFLQCPGMRIMWVGKLKITASDGFPSLPVSQLHLHALCSRWPRCRPYSLLWEMEASFCLEWGSFSLVFCEYCTLFPQTLLFPLIFFLLWT